MSKMVVRALLSQFTGFLLVYLLGHNEALPRLDLIFLACVQGVLAASTSILLRSPRWWVGIHLVFMPIAVAVARLNWPGWLYGVGFSALLGLYWTTFRTQVPLFLSNKVTIHRLAQWLPDEIALNVLDVGSGTGSFVAQLADLRPDWQVTGIEAAPVPFLISRWRVRGRQGARVIRGDFWRQTLASYDVVYAFLSPVPMADMWRKARREMRPGSWLISNSFAVPQLEPNARVRVDDRRGTTLYCYQIPGTTRR